MIRFVAATIGAALALSGCAHTNLGQVDYRVVDGSSKPVPSELRAVCPGCVQVGDRYRIGGGDLKPFESGEVFSMEIEQMSIGDNVIEGHVLGYNFDKEGEFAVLANVFEFASTAADVRNRRLLQSNEIARDAPDNTSDVEMKLIYYGDDIRAFQTLNFSNIPLHQRSTYNGGSVGVQLAVLEVDAGSGPMAKLMTTLARFGQKAIPVSSEVSDVLFDLGESLFSGGKGDDRLLEYRFVLSRASDDLDSTQALFTPGRYILRRTEMRGKQQEWGDVYFNPATGRLVGKNGQELRNELYIVINVRRYPEGTQTEHYDFERWSAVRNELAQASPLTTPLTTLQSRLVTKLAEERSSEWRDILINRWSLAESALRSLQQRHVPNLTDATISQCAAKQVALADRASDLAELRARDALREFRAQYQRASTASGAGGVTEFGAADQEQLASRVSQYFLPWRDDATREKFASLAFFGAMIGDAAELPTLAIETATSRARAAASCDDLPPAS